jgi:hypothetical protein
MNGLELARSLFAQIGQAERVEPVTDSDWRGEPNRCTKMSKDGSPCIQLIEPFVVILSARLASLVPCSIFTRSSKGRTARWLILQCRTDLSK